MPSRPTRVRTQTTHAGSSDSEPTNPEDTPRPKKPQRSGKKKRISDVFTPENRSAAGLDDTRAPLKPVDINDDAAEKRRRRKSTKFVRPPLGDVDPTLRTSEHGTPRSAARARANQLNVVEDAPAKVPFEVMSSNFEEWMKMATDNKINAANSWNFALIDYFHDMSLLRNVTDNSINFQKASCTLDGCVKIWTSRVDSVGTETGKLLSNLANEGDKEGGDVDDDVEPGADGSKKKTKVHRPEATLAKNVSQLRTKKLELEFTVDPLFKKTCADFDESGAQGLLMNHLALGLGGSLRVVFDAGDSTGAGTSEDDEQELQEPEDLIDLGFLIKDFIPSLDILDNKAISHSLKGFSFEKDAFSFDDVTYLNTTTHDDFQDEDSDGEAMDDFQNNQMDLGGDPIDEAAEQDFFVGEQAVHDDYGGENPVAEMELAAEGAEGGMMDYFDQHFLKNWAGPEHWKLRKAVRKVDPAEPTAPKAKREKKESFKIDFSSPSVMSVKDLYAPVTGRGASITLPTSKNGKGGKQNKVKDAEKRYDQTLPDDMHFSSRQLVTLFLKPKFSLKMRGRRAQINEGDGEVDENFWAQAAADQAAGIRVDEANETADGGAIPFNTQFFHDDYDDGPGFDDVYEGDGDAASGAGTSGLPEEQDLLATTRGQGRRARPDFVNYAKRAKRVDVRKLKENIWKGLRIVVPENAQDSDDRIMEPVAATDPSEARVFDSVIVGLQNSYPQNKMEEISTSFCFICLLHLANERGLKIEVGERGLRDVVVEQDTEEHNVGDLWGLRIYRDPDATPAA